MMPALFSFPLFAMFDFLFKKRSVPAAALPGPAANVGEQAAKLKNQEREAALLRALGFTGQEDAALAFLLKSEFADARLQALQHINSETALTEVTRAMRSTDRRVHRQAQEKLATIKDARHRQQAVQHCQQRASDLLSQEILLVNQLADWDRLSMALGEQAQDLLLQRGALEAKMQQQLALQRQVLRLSNAVQALCTMGLPSGELRARLAQSRQTWQAILEDVGFASIPKNQVSRLDHELKTLQALADRPTVVEMPVTVVESAPVLAIAAHPSELPVKTADPIGPHPDGGPELDTLLVALEQALEQGSLQQALELDKTLRGRVLPGRGEQAAHLQTLRAELTRLLDWARWGGDISRSELIKVADELFHSKQAPTEIGRQVGGLRSRWKELDRSSGAAGKPLWEQFDSACSRAYQIAQAHFKQQAQLRQEHLAAAQALLMEMAALITASAAQPLELPELQATLHQKKIAWRALGVIDRKLKTGLQLDFDRQWAILHAPLDAACEQAIARRRELIAQVTQIDPGHRQAVDQVKAAQLRWQQEALTLRLEHHSEQELWQQFRAGCDGLFAARKLQTEQVRQTQQQALQELEAYCNQLQAALDQSAPEVAKVLRAAGGRRATTAGQREVETRMNALIKQLELRHATLLHQEKTAGLTNLRARIALCRQLEVARAAPADAAQCALWQQQWQDLVAGPELTSAVSRLLNERFNEALAALNQASPDPQHTSPEVLARFEQSLLQLELLRNLPSPAGLAQQRLQLQISNLQTVMKQREAAQLGTALAHLQILCRLAVPLDEVLQQRFEAVLDDSPNFAGL